MHAIWPTVGRRVAAAGRPEQGSEPIRYGVRSAPTILVFRGGEPVANRVGLTRKQVLRELIGLA